MGSYDITQSNAAVRQLLEVTTNPRHRLLLTVLDRYRALRLAGRYQEIFESGMTVDHPVWHFNALGMDLIMDGEEEIATVWEEWTRTGQCIFYVEDEKLAVGDDMVASEGVLYQQTPGKSLVGLDAEVEASATYLVAAVMDLVWLFDSHGRVVRQDVWEIDPLKRRLIRIDPADVLSPQQAAELLDPFIGPAPRFAEALS